MLKEPKFRELSEKDPDLKKYYSLQDNGFYKVAVSEQDRELLKEKFRKLGFSALNFTDSRSVYQFYNLGRLWNDIQIALKNNITLWHPATEPLSAGELYQYLTGEEFKNELNPVPANYDYRTVHAEAFGGNGHYIETKETELEEIKESIELIQEWSKNVVSADVFMLSPDKYMAFNACVMRLQVIG